MPVIAVLLCCAILLQSSFTAHAGMNLKSAQALSTAVLAGASPRGNVCQHLRGLVKRQKKICRRYPKLMASVVRGYMIGIRECQWQFKHHQWNCSATTSDATSIFGSMLDKGTREAAYVLAVTSAGVSHSVTRACSSGLHDNCGCDRTIYDQNHNQKHRWSGCSDNIHFGDAFARRFIDSYERRTMRRNPGLALMKLHNNGAGRLSLVAEMKIKCKCHGVSGSCELKTCWRSLPAFREVGIILRQRFDNAMEVIYHNKELQPRLYLGPGSSIPPTNLVYLQESENFCTSRPGQLSSTSGRSCNHTSSGQDSCEKLCCNRRYMTRIEMQSVQCNCKFKWCCTVKCKTCSKAVQVSVCE